MLLAGSCASRIAPAWIEGPGSHELTSFLGISFGESIADAQRRYPDGAMETSPYGAGALRLESLTSDPVEYDQVIFEFADRDGMQLIIAHFKASSAATLYDQLTKRLGPPASNAGGADTPPTQASWLLTNQVEVNFNGADNSLAIVGPKGGLLKPDIKLRGVYGS